MSNEKRRSVRRTGVIGWLLFAHVLATAVHAEETYTIAPGPEGEDVSYYSFIPLLNRGQYTTMYAHTSFSPTGSEHSMSSFIKFPLPVDLLDVSPPPGPGEMATVLDAFLIMNFAFSFSHTGDPPEPNGELSVHRVNQDWSEATLTYANHPTSDPPHETISGIGALGPIIFDVSDIVAEWAHGEGPNYGFELSNPFEDPIGFHTFESPVDPLLKARLVVTVPEPSVSVLVVAGSALLGGLGRARRMRLRG